MIQRIQSLYLLLTSVLMFLLLFLPLGRFLGGDQEFLLTAFGIRQADGDSVIVSTWYMGILIGMAAILPLINIFFYKRRLLQIRLCFMEIIFLAGVQVFVIFYLYHATSSFHELDNNSVAYSLTDVFPLVGIIFTWLANRGIMKDEALVRSVNRIR